MSLRIARAAGLSVVLSSLIVTTAFAALSTGEQKRLNDAAGVVTAIRNADNGLAFIVDDNTPLGSGWDGDGGLFVLAADSLLFANQVTLGRIESDGSVDPPILVTGSVSGAALLGLRDGYAAIALTVTRPSAATQIVLVNLVDPARITALALPTEATGALIGVELGP